jgi:hypothetical protein
MFEVAHIIGSPRSSIVLQTRLGNPIENVIEPEIGFPEINKFELLKKMHGANWEIRRPATGRYNCAGLVFANRRTSIMEPKLYEKIFADDGYRKFSGSNDTRSGDIVSYFDVSTNEIMHLGLIVRFAVGFGGNISIPWALSKWNSATGEVVHSIYEVPYRKSEYRIDFWTDRPA